MCFFCELPTSVRIYRQTSLSQRYQAQLSKAKPITVLSFSRPSPPKGCQADPSGLQHPHPPSAHATMTEHPVTSLASCCQGFLAEEGYRPLFPHTCLPKPIHRGHSRLPLHPGLLESTETLATKAPLTPRQAEAAALIAAALERAGSGALVERAPARIHRLCDYR